MKDPDTALQALREHATACGQCSHQPLPLAALAALLSRHAADVDAPPASARVAAALRPELARRSARAFWRQLALVLLGALMPLPAVLAYDAYVLRAAYAAITAVIPDTVALYVIGADAAFLLLLFAATYAAIPLLVAHQLRRPVLS